MVAGQAKERRPADLRLALRSNGAIEPAGIIRRVRVDVPIASVCSRRIRGYGGPDTRLQIACGLDEIALVRHAYATQLRSFIAQHLDGRHVRTRRRLGGKGPGRAAEVCEQAAGGLALRTVV